MDVDARGHDPNAALPPGDGGDHVRPAQISDVHGALVCEILWLDSCERAQLMDFSGCLNVFVSPTIDRSKKTKIFKDEQTD